MDLNGMPSYLAEQEFSRRVAKDCCVQMEGNWYSVPAALVPQNVMVQIRDQQVVIRQRRRIVALHAGHWEGLVSKRLMETAWGVMAPMLRRWRWMRCLSLARPLSDYAAVVAEAG